MGPLRGDVAFLDMWWFLVERIVVLNLLIGMQPRRSGDSLPLLAISSKEHTGAYIVEDALRLEAVHVLRLPSPVGDGS